MVGDVGRLLAFVFTVLLAALAPGWRVVVVLALAALLALTLSRQAIGLAARDRSWPLLALLVVGLGAIMGDLTLEVGPVALSPDGLSLGTQMLLRALAILLAVHTLTSALSLSTVAALFERLGLKGLGFALGVAVNALPIVQRNFQEVATALRLRGGFRRRRFHALRLLLLATTVNSVRHAEEIVAAAEARGFRVDRRQPMPLHWQRGDLALMGLLLVVAAIVLSNW